MNHQTPIRSLRTLIVLAASFSAGARAHTNLQKPAKTCSSLAGTQVESTVIFSAKVPHFRAGVGLSVHFLRSQNTRELAAKRMLQVLHARMSRPLDRESRPRLRRFTRLL